MSSVLLLDHNSEIIGISEKINAHKTGAFHLAFSILILNSKFEMLIQKRARHKYHTGGLWSNACCSHPTSVTNIEFELRERLKYEMGIDSQLRWLFNHQYYAELDNAIVENEFDRVYLGFYEGQPTPNVKEVDDWKWVSFCEIDNTIENSPELYTPWFIQIYMKFKNDCLRKIQNDNYK